MVSSNYFSGRKKYLRPQALIFSNNSNGILDGVPQIDGVEGEDFIILSDHNRSEISISSERIENRKRMANAHMRSYHLADKLNISMSWNLIPSRAFSGDQTFSASGQYMQNLTEYTVDGGAGGADLFDWYENNTGSFYVFVAYDRPSIATYDGMSGYAEVYEVFFSSFEFNIIKRGMESHDLWNVSLALEEV